jgi:RNA polymerase sigma factor (sigma-70 family)
MSVAAKMQQEQPDEELMRQFRLCDDGEYLCILFDRYKKRIYLSCKMFLQDAGAAEDATQETFLRIIQNPERFSEGRFSAWAMRIARNVCIDMWRRNRHRIEVGEQYLVTVGNNESLEHTAEMMTIGKKLREEIARLPEYQRRCIEMKIEGCSYEEMAVITGLSVMAIKSHLQNGRRTLWIHMEKVLA